MKDNKEMEKYQAYPEEVLEACRNGKCKLCSYGICDECPNTLRDVKNDEENEA